MVPLRPPLSRITTEKIMKITKKMADEVLVRGLELLSKKGAWMQDDFGNKDEIMKANCFCAVGVCARAAAEIALTLDKPLPRNICFWELRLEGAGLELYSGRALDAALFTEELCDVAVVRLEDVLMQDRDDSSVSHFNDDMDRTQDEVVKLFVKAIAETK